MKTSQKKWSRDTGWIDISPSFSETPQLVFLFGGKSLLAETSNFDEVKNMYKDSAIISGSTAGEIINTEVLDDALSLTAVYFEKTQLTFVQDHIDSAEQSYDVGKRLVSQLPTDKLVHVMVFSDGLKVNGTSLVRGITEILPSTVSVTGGLVGDGPNFTSTLLGLNNQPTEGTVVAIGFYGDSLKIGYGSLGGWDPFGPERIITKSTNNVLYELDNENALNIYKEYLGEKAKELPSSGLLFPMRLTFPKENGNQVQLVRTLLGIDEKTQSMTFAGDMPEGISAQLMKANFERLIDGAQNAANMSLESLQGSKPDLAILISCIGRKLVLKERTVEEIEEVRRILGPQTTIAGFYSYGEICPTTATEKQCELHNQTMTITTFRET